MKLTKTLYNRLVAAFIFTTFIISGLYGVLVFNAMEYTEDDILSRRLELEKEYYLRRYSSSDQIVRLPSSIGLSSYLSSSLDLPSWLKDESPGSRELHDRELHINVSELPNNQGRLYLTLSEQESSSLESELSNLFIILVSVGLFITLIGLIVGVLLGKYITTPLNRLTSEINFFDRDEKYQKKLTFYGADRSDEVGALSRAFSRLVNRLSDFLNREKEFTRYASHELRTPLSIMRNSLATLKLPNPTAERNERNFQRIDNSILEMNSLIDTFLYLGREEQSIINDTVDIERVLECSLDKHAYIDEDKAMLVTKNIEPNISIVNDSKLIQILFDNIVRNMYLHGKSTATITSSKGSVMIENNLTSIGITGSSIDSYGLKIIERISEYCHLKVEFFSTEATFKVMVFFD